MDQGFGKNEKLKSRKDIEELFISGKSLKKYPLLLIHLKELAGNTNRAAFTVSSRKFRKAHDRNRIKRLMRESYRLNKFRLQPLEGLKFIFIYLPGEELSYKEVNKSMEFLLEKLKTAYSLQSE